MPSEQIRLPTRSRSTAYRALLLLTAWFLSSSVAIIVTKALFSGADRRLRPFPFGLTVTATNNVVASCAAALLLSGRREQTRDSNVDRIALVIGATTAAEIGLSNIALNLLSVSFATVLKGMAPFFVMSWGVVFGLQRVRFGLICVMLVIGVGLTMAVAGESDHNSSWSDLIQAGFVAQLISGVLSGFRWILTQVFVKGDSIGNDTISTALNIRPLSRGLSAIETIRLTAPYTLMWVLPFLVFLEGGGVVTWFKEATFMDTINIFTALTVIGVCVYLLLWAEYELVKVTSSLTVSVGFVFKEVLVIFAGALIFNDRLSPLTIAGFVVVQAGILGYAILRIRQANYTVIEN